MLRKCTCNAISVAEGWLPLKFVSRVRDGVQLFVPIGYAATTVSVIANTKVAQRTAYSLHIVVFIFNK